VSAEDERAPIVEISPEIRDFVSVGKNLVQAVDNAIDVRGSKLTEWLVAPITVDETRKDFRDECYLGLKKQARSSSRSIGNLAPPKCLYQRWC